MEERNATYEAAGKQSNEDIAQCNDWRLLFAHRFGDGKRSSSSIVCQTFWRIIAKNNW